MSIASPTPRFLRADAAGVRQIVFALAAAAFAEAVLLRLFTRVAIHIPAFPILQTPEAILAFMGRYAYFLAAVLLMIALPVLIVALIVAARDGRTVLCGISAGAVIAFATLAGAVRTGAGDSVVAELAILLAAATLAGVTAISGGRLAVPVGLFGLSFFLNGVATLSQRSLWSVTEAGADRLILSASEIAFVAFAISSLVLAGRPIHRHEKWLATLVGGTLLLPFLTGGSATVGILLLWNVGLSGWLPGVLYAAAGAALTVAILGRAREGEGPTAAGVLLLLLGGSGLHSTYQTGLVFVGLGVLALVVFGSKQPADRPARAALGQNAIQDP